jgi:hypothetical protein
MLNDRLKCVPFFATVLRRMTVGRHSREVMFLQVFSSSTCAIRGLEGVTTSFAMTESSHASTKTKGVNETIWYLCSKGVDAFYLIN